MIAVECPSTVKCAHPITAHTILVITPGVMQVTCPTRHP